MRQGQQEGDVAGWPAPLADLPPNIEADQKIVEQLHLKSLDPNRRKQFHDVLMSTTAGRAWFAGFLFDLGLFQSTLPTYRAVVMRDIAAHMLFSTGITINESWILAWFEQMGGYASAANAQQLAQQHPQQQQDGGAQHVPGAAPGYQAPGY